LIEGMKEPKTEHAKKTEGECAPLESAGAVVVEAADPTVELRAKIESLEDGLLRSRADYQNLQRRSATERIEAVRFANAELIRALLGVVDDLDRTLSAVEEHRDAEAVAAGVRLAQQNFLKVLRDHGVEVIDAANQPFDPTLHNALMRQSSATIPAGSVVQQVATGYRLRERVLRPAMVIVSSGPEAEAGAEQAQTPAS
jgi:molecular chaperone GrpE